MNHATSRCWIFLGLLWGATSLCAAPNYGVPVERDSEAQGFSDNQQSNTQSRSSSGGAEAGNPMWELYDQIQQLQNEVQRLNGMIEQQSRDLEDMRRQQKERYLDLDRRLGGGSSAPAAPAAPAAAAQTAATNDELAPSIIDANQPLVAPTAAPDKGPLVENEKQFFSEKEKYASAQTLVKQRKLPEAKQSLEEFLQQYPKGAFAPNAYYWLGEISMGIDPPDNQAARGYFMQVIEKFPGHSKVAAAIYKLGVLANADGDKAKAKQYLQRVVREYPGSTAASLSKAYLESM